MKKINILGSTGSIGTQALDVIRENNDRFCVGALTCGKNIELIAKQAAEFCPELVVTETKEGSERLKEIFHGTHLRKTKVLHGAEGLIEAALSECDMVLNSLMGMRGMMPTLAAIKNGTDVALANKETLVAGGEAVMNAVKANGVRLLPVDSEHSAIFQCLQGNEGKHIKKIILTASGGPFRGYSKGQLKEIKPEQALKHPNWTMGQKITIDSSTLMNKGLELIEAKWLFDVDPEDIEVVVHPQSIIHSAVEFDDTAVIAQLGIPDMRIPISVALGYPDRLTYKGEALDLFSCGPLTFEKPDMDVFECLHIAIESIRKGKTYPAVMNAANEVLVEAFLNRQIGFTDIPALIKEVLADHDPLSGTDAEAIANADAEARAKTYSLISKYFI